MSVNEEIEQLKARLKELSASRYHRFNVLLKKEIFEKLEKKLRNKRKVRREC